MFQFGFQIPPISLIKSLCHKEMTKIWRQWLANDPQIQKQLQTVKNRSKRKLSNLHLSSQKKRKYINKQLKSMNRDAVIKEHRRPV